MKKQKRTIFLAMGISMSLMAGMALAACGGTETHSLTLHQAKDATCTEAGNAEYYSCSDCGKLFSDAEGKNEVTLDEVTIAALGHKPVAVEAKEATCTEDGYIAHYVCENGCGTYFSDAEGQNVIDEDDVVLAKLNHKDIEEVQPAIDAEAGRGWIYHWACPDCGKYFADSFGDAELPEDEVFFDKIDSVTVTLTGKKAGGVSPIPAGDASLVGVDYNVTASGTVSTTLTLTDVYPIAYAVSCAGYSGTITFEAGKTEYSAELIYASFAATGENAGAVDLTHMSDEDAYITIANPTDGFAFAEVQDIGELGDAYYLQANVRVEGASFTEWGDLLYFMVSDGADPASSGMALWMSLAADNIHVCRVTDLQGAIDGKANDMTSAAMCSEITSRIYSADGLNVRVLRIGKTMNLYYEGAEGWVYFYSFDNCEGEARLMLGASGATSESSRVVYSEISFAKYNLTYHERAQDGDNVVLAHYTDESGNYYTEQGAPTTLAAITLTYHAQEYKDGTLILAHYTDAEGNYYTESIASTTLEKLSYRQYASEGVTIEEAADFNLNDPDAAYWMNPIYYEIYQQTAATPSTITAEGDDLIHFDPTKVTLVSDDGNNGAGIMLDGSNRSHLKVNGDNAFGDIAITVGKDAKQIVVWAGAWLAKVRVSLYDGETLVGSAEYEANWYNGTFRNATNWKITFGIDNSSLDDAAKTYTLRIEFLESCAGNGDVRIHLSGIAVCGEAHTLTYHEGNVFQKAHYTDEDGNYYTEDKVLTTQEAIVISYTIEDSFDTNLGDPDSAYWLDPIYYEIYQQTGATSTVIAKPDSDDLIDFDPTNVTLVNDDPDNGKGIKLDGTNLSHLKVDGHNSFGDITITVGSGAKGIAVWTGTWLAEYRVSLYEGDRLCGVVDLVAGWDPGDANSINKLIIFGIDTSGLTGDATKTYTLRIEYVRCDAGENDARIRLAGIAVLGDVKELTYYEETTVEGKITLAHYTDEDGKFYTPGKVLTTEGALLLTHHAEGIENGYYMLEHYTDGDGRYYLPDRTLVEFAKIAYRQYTSEGVTMEEASDFNLTDPDAAYWMNPIYYEIYQQTGATPSTIAAEGSDLINFDPAKVTLSNDDGNNGRGIILDGTNRSHLKVDGNNSFGDIAITVGKDAKQIVVWAGAWLAKVRVSLYDGETLVGSAEYEANWSNGEFRNATNWKIVFGIDNSALADGATKIYTLRIEYLGTCADNGNARIHLSGIAVCGEAHTLTYHEETVENVLVTFAHYTDEDGTYYTADKVRTTLEKLQAHYSMTDSVDTDLTKSDALYYEIYQQTGATPTVVAKPDAKDMISFDPTVLTLVSDDSLNGNAAQLDGANKSELKVDGNNSYSDIEITVGKGANRIAVWTGSWLATYTVSLYDGDTLIGTATVVGNWDVSAPHKLITFYIDTSDLADGETRTYTLKIAFKACVADNTAARVNLGGIAVYEEEEQASAEEQALPAEKK